MPTRRPISLATEESFLVDLHPDQFSERPVTLIPWVIDEE